MHGALDRYEQAKREHYRGLNKEEIMPFLPTTKQIIENQAVRDVKGEMILMRGHILSNFQKMRSDMDRIREDVAKSDTRFKYANAEYQDSLKREMSMRDNQMIDVLDHIRQWNPNQVVHPQDQQYSHKHLAKVPDFYIPQLNFESMTNELRQKLEELKNPHVFRNTAARKLDEYQSQTKFMVEPKTYIRAEELRAGSVFVNPNSKYLDEVIEQDRHQERLQRATRVREMEEAKRKGTKFSNHSSEGNQLNPNDEHKAAAGRLDPTKSHQHQKENSLAKDKEPSKASTAKVDIKKTPPQKIEESGEEEEQDNGSQQIGHLEGEEESQVDDSIADAIGDVNNKKDGVNKAKVEKDDEEGEEESNNLIEDEEGGLLDDDELDGYEESEIIEDKKGNKKDSKPSKNDDEY